MKTKATCLNRWLATLVCTVPLALFAGVSWADEGTTGTMEAPSVDASKAAVDECIKNSDGSDAAVAECKKHTEDATSGEHETMSN